MPEVQSQAEWEPQLLEPFTTCAPCLDALDELEWVAECALQVGKWALGVRSSNADVDAALRRVLREHVVDVAAPNNFSLLMAGNDARAFNFLYQANDVLVRTRTPGRVLRALVQHLSEFAEPAVPTVRIHATGFFANGAVIVAPDELRAEIPNIETRLNVAGLRVIDSPVLHIDPETAQLVIPEPALRVDAGALAEYEDAHPAKGREQPPVLPGRYPIAAWALLTAEDRTDSISAAQGVAAAAQLVKNADALGAQQTLEVVAAALAGATVAGLTWDAPGELVGRLAALGSGGA